MKYFGDYMIMEKFSDFNLYTWSKGNNSQYLSCNENLARIAGFDSNYQMKKKFDYDLPWKKSYEYIVGVDSLVASNKRNYVNVIEILHVNDGIMTMLVSKLPLLNKSGKCVGTVGYGVDITGYTLFKDTSYINNFDGKFYLGKKFGNKYLTRREVEVFYYILMGYSTKKIASYLNLSVRTIEEHINKIKSKLKCSSKCEIISTSVKYGLTYILNSI